MSDTAVIELSQLTRRYGKIEAIEGLNLTVRPGCCYGFFGRNGAGKTTTIQCMLNLLRPSSGSVRIFGLDPRKAEVEVKSRLAYVPDAIAFYPWMTVHQTLEYFASFRARWNYRTEVDLMERFGLKRDQQASSLSKGQKTQLALITAVCAEPELLVLDEPTSGLDPIVRREFIETVIGAYQATAPENRTVFVSTHLISEFEGLIDEFTIIDQGRELFSMSADDARARFKQIRARFVEPAETLRLPGALDIRQTGRDVVILANGESGRLIDALRADYRVEAVSEESLSLEEIFIASKALKAGLR